MSHINIFFRNRYIHLDISKNAHIPYLAQEIIVPVNSASLKSIIDVKVLTRRFGGLTAVNRVEFAVHQGEIFGFLGAIGV
jgi:ABC-type glutathione transport system ATPase component